MLSRFLDCSVLALRCYCRHMLVLLLAQSCSIDLPNVLRVGSLDASRVEDGDRISPWSNYGLRSVDILAPGKDISAARFGGGYVTHSGTSMASPYMAHEAARLWMEFPALTAVQVRDIFVRSARRLGSPVLSGGAVDFAAAERLARETVKGK